MFALLDVMPIINGKSELSSTMWEWKLSSLIDWLIWISRSMSSESEAIGLSKASESSTDLTDRPSSSDSSSLSCTAQLFHLNSEPIRGTRGF